MVRTNGPFHSEYTLKLWMDLSLVLVYALVSHIQFTLYYPARSTWKTSPASFSTHNSLYVSLVEFVAKDVPDRFWVSESFKMNHIVDHKNQIVVQMNRYTPNTPSPVMIHNNAVHLGKSLDANPKPANWKICDNIVLSVVDVVNVQPGFSFRATFINPEPPPAMESNNVWSWVSMNHFLSVFSHHQLQKVGKQLLHMARSSVLLSTRTLWLINIDNSVVLLLTRATGPQSIVESPTCQKQRTYLENKPQRKQRIHFRHLFVSSDCSNKVLFSTCKLLHIFLTRIIFYKIIQVVF